MHDKIYRILVAVLMVKKVSTLTDFCLFTITAIQLLPLTSCAIHPLSSGLCKLLHHGDSDCVCYIYDCPSHILTVVLANWLTVFNQEVVGLSAV